MSYLNTINIFRRSLTKLVTQTIGNSKSFQHSTTIDKESIKKILIIRPNHRLGNMLLITPMVEEVSTTFPNCKIDLFVKGSIASTLFENYNTIDKIIELPKKHFKNLHRYILGWLHLKTQKYDLVINTVAFSSSGKLATKLANAKYKYYGIEVTKEEQNNINEEEKHVAKSTILGFRTFLSERGIQNKHNEIPTLNIKLSSIEINNGKKELYQLAKNNAKIISLFTYATGTKCYSEQWWLNFYDLLKLNFPSYTIIEVLPVEKISKINFKAPSFYSKNLRQIAALIANTDLFIGADSGMMHLASASKATTVGLFSVTDPNIFGPYGNNSLAINTNTKNQEDSIEIIKNLLAS